MSDLDFIETFGEEDLPAIAERLAQLTKQVKIVLLYGDLGAGKTTLVKEICRQKGVEEEVSSPTYSIANEYLAGEKKIVHFDFYRISKLDEIIDLDFYKYLDESSCIFIEWPEIVEPLLDSDCLSVTLAHRAENRRQIDVKHRKI